MCAGTLLICSAIEFITRLTVYVYTTHISDANVIFHALLACIYATIAIQVADLQVPSRRGSWFMYRLVAYNYLVVYATIITCTTIYNMSGFYENFAEKQVMHLVLGTVCFWVGMLVCPLEKSNKVL